MKSLTRTIIVLSIINLTIGNLASAQEAAVKPERPRLSRRGVRIPTKPEPVESAIVEPIPATLPEPIPEPEPVPTPMTAPPASRPYGMGAFGLSRNRKVLVIPATNIEAENLVAITEDLQVMSHIFDERFKEPQEIQGVFVDFGDIFGRDRRSTEAIYMQGYGVLFLMEVNFTFSPEPEPHEQEVKETEEYVDPDWQRAKRKLFSPQSFGGRDLVPEEQYNAQQIDQIKTELIRTLKHTANIRNIKPDEWIILTVIGQARQSGGMYEDYYRSTDPRTGTSRSRGRSSSRSGRSGGGMYGGGMDARSGMGGMMGGMGGMGGYSEMYGGRGMGGMGGGIGGGMYGGMGAIYSETGSASTTILTIRAKKTDVDRFAKGELDFEKFQQQKVEIFTY
jgi:hypothetical protein